MYNIFLKQIYIKYYNIIRASHGKLTSLNKLTFQNIYEETSYKLTFQNMCLMSQ